MHQIIELDSLAAQARLTELAEILVDVVAGGASVSFMSPFSQAEAIEYWQGIIASVEREKTVLLVALLGDRAVGTVQLQLATPPNQPHRADVAKLLVHRSARRQGIARALMQQIEVVAQQHDRTLLTLDTLTNSAAERLYLSIGYVPVGVIPHYAYYPNGVLADTCVFYKQL